MLGQNNVCGIARTAISFVVIAIVPTSVGIRRTEVQFLAGTASCPASMAATRKKAILKEAMPGATRFLAASHDEYSWFNSTKAWYSAWVSVFLRRLECFTKKVQSMKDDNLQSWDFAAFNLQLILRVFTNCILMRKSFYY